MAINQVLGTDKTIRLNNFNTLGLVQNFNWAPNFNAQDVFELGRTTRLDTMMELETSGSFEIMSAGNLAGMLARMKVKTNSGTGAFEGFDFAPTASGTGVNGYTYTQDDLANLRFDIIEHAKTDQTNFDRSTYLACCYPTNITGRVQSNGTASDTVNFAGLYVVGFPKPFHDVRSVACAKASASTLTLLDSGYTSGWTLAYVTIDGIPYTTDNTKPVYATFSSGTITMSAGYTVPAGVVAMAVLYKNSGTSSWSALHTPETVGSGASAVYGVRGFQANVYIAPTDAGSPVSSEQWLRVQSLDYTIDFRLEALRQVAYNALGTSIYRRVPTFPFTMSANATVLETDWADWKAMLNKTFTGADVYQNTYDFAPATLKKSFAVVVDYFTKDGTKIQRLTFGDMRPESVGSRVQVGGRSEITWGFRGSSVKIEGFNI